MGLMRFLVCPPQRITEAMVQQAYLSGIDRVSWPVRTAVEKGQLLLQRAVSDSANLHVPWLIEGRGWLTLTTGSLMEQAQPYQLPLELARGTIAQLRNQLSEWQTMGLAMPPAVTAKTSGAVGAFARAVVLQDDPPAAAKLAEEAIRIALDAGDLMAAAYVEYAMAARRRSGGKPTALLGANLGGSLPEGEIARQLLLAFNAAAVPISWREVEAVEDTFSWETHDRQIEWCRANGLKVCGGPLLMLDGPSLPDWLCLWEGDFERILAFGSEFLQRAVNRYRGKVDVWQCAGRVNTAEILSLSEEEKLQLAARAIELVRALDPAAAAVVSFDQPWAEYLSRREMDFPPLQLADALVRAGLDLTGLMLEINLGYHPGGTLPRSPLELNRQLEYWRLLGLPLWVSLTVPSTCDHDTLALRQAKPSPGNWTAKAQQAWVARCVPLILAKPYVQGVVWNQLCDSQPHDFPHGGLFTAEGQAKPALKTLAAIRQAYLK
jgi:hypothetical protein